MLTPDIDPTREPVEHFVTGEEVVLLLRFISPNRGGAWVGYDKTSNYAAVQLVESSMLSQPIAPPLPGWVAQLIDGEFSPLSGARSVSVTDQMIEALRSIIEHRRGWFAGVPVLDLGTGSDPIFRHWDQAAAENDALNYGDSIRIVEGPA